MKYFIIYKIKFLQNEIRDFKLSGCHLEDDKKKRLEEISLRLSELFLISFQKIFQMQLMLLK